MARSKRLALLSLVSGTLAIPFAVVGTYLQSIRGSGSGVLLIWLEKLGVVKEPTPVDPSITIFHFPSLGSLGAARGPAVNVTGAPAMSEAGYFSINDENAIAFVVALGIVLGLVAMVTALWAEYRREPSLYLSAGYVCGALAITQIRTLAGLVFFIVGITSVLVMRHQREE